MNENMIRSVEKDGVLVFDYRFMADNLPTYIRLKASIIDENGKPFLILVLLDEDAQIKREQELEHDLRIARNRANNDALTGVKNKYAYVDAEKDLNKLIDEGQNTQFAIVVSDINNLKLVNDTLHHKTGDRNIKKACMTICDIFKKSPVFRVGGDEFAIICKNDDYEHLNELLAKLDEINLNNKEIDDLIIAFGAAQYEEGHNAETVFELADQLMYKYKAKIKE